MPPSVRLFVTLLSIVAASVVPASAAGADAIEGSVVDPAGRPVARALVRVVDGGGNTVATSFTSADGRFRVSADIPGGCRVEVSLTGFVPSQHECTPNQPIRLMLAVAPIAESVVVSATRSEAPAGQIAAGVTVFDAEDIERRQRPPVADLLRTSVGTSVVRVGGPGGVTSLFVRGGESNYNKVLLDGIPLNEPGGTFNFSSLTSEHLDRIELVRGAQSALFGSDAMASVVQLFTRRARTDGTSLSMSLDGGSFDTARGTAAVAGRRGGFDYSLFAGRAGTDNEVPNNTFRETTLSLSAGVQINERTALRFVGRGEMSHAGTPGAALFGRPDQDAFFDRDDGVGGVTLQQRLSDTLEHRATYALSSTRYQSTNLELDPPYRPSFEGRQAPFDFFDFAFDSHTSLKRHHVGYQADWHIPVSGRRTGTQISTFAFDWDGERATLEDRLNGGSTEASRDNFGWTAQHQALWSRTFVTAGVRIENNESFGTSAVPRASVAYIARASGGAVGATKLKAAAGLGIKEPTILQSYSMSPFNLGNPDLLPEKSRSVEAGIEQRFAQDRAKIELTWFDNRFRNIISTRTLSFTPFTAQYFNVGLTRARGAELTAETAPVRGLRASFGYTFLDSEILESTAPTNPVFRPGQWLFRRPRHSGFAEIGWSRDRLAMSTVGIFTGKRVDGDFSSLEPPILENEGVSRWDAHASYRVRQELTVYAAIDNLTDADYMEPLGYPALGRALRIGVRVGLTSR